MNTWQQKFDPKSRMQLEEGLADQGIVVTVRLTKNAFLAILNQGWGASELIDLLDTNLKMYSHVVALYNDLDCGTMIL